VNLKHRAQNEADQHREAVFPLPVSVDHIVLPFLLT
jgi:hypothetical protein